jgi:hypothetical protein
MGETTAVLNVSRAYIKTTGAHHFATVHCSLQNICLKKSPMQKDKEQEGERESIQQLSAMPQDCNVPQGEKYTLFK